jgi:phosphoglycolate phosphatase
MPPKPTAVIFDWDGTLLNTVPLIYRAINKTHDAFGQPHEDPAQVRQYTSYVKEVSFAQRFGATNVEKALQLYTEFVNEEHDPTFANSDNHADLILPHADTVLEYLHAQNIPMYVLSNKTSHWLHDEVKYLGWQKYFTIVYGAQDTDHNKPDARAAHQLLKKAELNAAKNIWFVGDSFADIHCANTAGLTSILIGEAVDAVPHMHFASHTELLNTLQVVIR